jgi:hypothetical protein
LDYDFSATSVLRMAVAMSVISGIFSQVAIALAVPLAESTLETFSWNFS